MLIISEEFVSSHLQYIQAKLRVSSVYDFSEK